MGPWLLRRVLIAIAAFSVTLPLSANAEMEVKNVAGTSCMTCHGSTPEYPVLGARMTYDTSGHKRNGNSAYANGGGCQRCHTNEGFIDYVATGAVNNAAFVDYPSQPGCFTCHEPHESGTLDLRTVEPVTLANKTAFDLGSGNLCANCHQARANAAEFVKPLAARAINANWGAHRGPQADVLMGTNAFEDPRKSYATSAHTYAVSDGCVVCHMSLPDGRYAFSPELGGHSFRIASEVHEAPKINTSGCIACHPTMKQVAGKEVFDIRAKTDYDLDGATEVVQEEVRGLLERMSNASGTGVLQTLAIPFYKPDGTFNASTAETIRPIEEVAAIYNYKMILEDRSLGVHNPTYVIQVLYDSISALDRGFDTSRRP
jgi:hypothetical protein